MELLGLDIAEEVADAMGDDLLPATLYRRTHVDGSDPTDASSVTTVVLDARGFKDDYKEYQIDGKQIVQGDVKVCLLGATITGLIPPQSGDLVQIDGSTWTIIRVGTDPAKALYVCQSRGL